ncbi:ROK family transcriptional regulator [Sphingomonas sp. 2R-10]|uniref:ROK family transcriptional regulator n=1 Tax=Sphingomonas sp. 2R-10 TaxID=3045148 RepID=UPI0019D07C51|nr:ROK family transcriptional regulator [Sphingomonas sp. 2R-10]MDJ0278692.1 ROK family transcriptional regulator [Sphingomonas sp. 2R-10]
MTDDRAPIRLSGTNLERAADHNQRVTLHAIRVSGSLTRIDLANITGLTPPAIANITRRLLGEGLVQEAGQRRGGRGQPPTKLVVNPAACYAIGINVDRDHVTIVLVDFAGQTLARASREVDFAMPDDVAAFYRSAVEGLIAEAGIDRQRIVGIGVARPDDLGTVDLPGRPDAYTIWEGADMAALFGEPIALPVFVENDAAAAAMGELQLGHGQHHASFFYILISSALGGGLVLDGSYYRGAQGRSGELGFLLGTDGRGGQTQIQHTVSLSGLSHPLRDAGFTLADMLGGRADDPALLALVDAWIDASVERLVEPLTAINCLINPAAIFVGGRLPGAHVDTLAERMNARMRVAATNVPALAPVRRAMLAEDAPAVGAAILPFSHFLLPSATALWKAEEGA